MSAITGLSAEQTLQLVNERQAGYRSESARSRLARAAHRAAGRPARSASRRGAIRSLVEVIGPDFATDLPRLTNYPYRG